MVGAAAPPVVANFIVTPTNGPAPLTVQFTDTSTGNPTGWEWNFGDFSYTGGWSVLQNPSYTYSQPNLPDHPFRVSLRVTNASPQTSEYLRPQFTSTSEKTIMVTIPPAPVASFIATPTGGSVPLTVQFTDTSTGNPTHWDWSFGDGGHSDLQNPSYTFKDKCRRAEQGITPLYGTSEVDLTVGNVYANYTHAVGYIIFEKPPSQPVSHFIATPTSGPAPLTVQFTDISTGSPNKWHWDFGTGIWQDHSSERNPSFTYTISGVYTVYMEAENTWSCRWDISPWDITSANTTITVLSPLAPGTTTSPTSSLTQTTTITTTTAAPTTTVTTAIPTTIATTIQTTEPTTSATTPPITSIYTPTSSRTPTSTFTLKKFTPWPTDTPTQPSPFGAEIGIIATIGAALLVMKRK